MSYKLNQVICDESNYKHEKEKKQTKQNKQKTIFRLLQSYNIKIVLPGNCK